MFREILETSLNKIMEEKRKIPKEIVELDFDTTKFERFFAGNILKRLEGKRSVSESYKFGIDSKEFEIRGSELYSGGQKVDKETYDEIHQRMLRMYEESKNILSRVKMFYDTKKADLVGCYTEDEPSGKLCEELYKRKDETFFICGKGSACTYYPDRERKHLFLHKGQYFVALEKVDAAWWAAFHLDNETFQKSFGKEFAHIKMYADNALQLEKERMEQE